MNWQSYLFFLCVGVVGLSACQRTNELSFSEEKMVAVMADMQLAEASMQRLTKKIKDTLSLRYYDEIYEIHDIDEAALKQNHAEMDRNPKLAKRIYDAVKEEIRKQENE